ncbi:META domain-containing protein [Ferrimonas senticii]|uniref:META domain-containing protein n=1 Tax=Ferrimonas senticii TaxID=394566 RepID=UPI0012EB3F1B|nr:META domain-containing protein [Ferrimonas senticii]
MKQTRVVAALLMAAVISGCQQTPDVASTEEAKQVQQPVMMAATAAMLKDTNWQLVQFNGNDIDANMPVSMGFSASDNPKFDLRVGGVAACNNYGTSVKLDSAKRNFSIDANGFMVTMKMCAEPELAQMEANFMLSLRNNQSLQLTAAEQLLMVDNIGNRYLFSKL